MTRKVEHLIQFEQLEPRILLSGDSLLNIAPEPHEDTILDKPPLVVQYVELLDTHEQVEGQINLELVPSDTPNTDVCQPIITLLVDDDNTNDESIDANLSVDDIGSGIGTALVLGVDLFEENDVKPNAEDVDSECFESCQRQLIIEQLTDTLRVPHGPPDADGVLTSLDDVQLEYIDAGGQIDLVVRLNTQNSTVIEVFDNNEGSLLASYALSEINSLMVIGGDNSNDILTVDLSNPFSIPGGIVFVGGDGGYDKLVLIGNSELTAEYVGQGDDDGTVIVSGEEGDPINLSYSGLEPFVYLNEFGAVRNSGIFNYGNSPDILPVDTFSQGSGDTLVIEIGGLNPGPGASDPDDPDYNNGYDQINVTGTATLDGRLQIQLINTLNFNPSLGDSFEVMTFGSVVGDFAIFSGYDLGGGLYLAPVKTAQIYRLDVVDYDPTVAFGDASNNLNDVINALLAFKFDPNVDSDPSGSFVFPTADLDWPDVVTIGQTIGGGADLELQDVTLTFSEMQYDFMNARWTGEVGVTAPFAVLFPDLLSIGIVDDGLDAPRRVDSATGPVLQANGKYQVVFTLAGDHTDIESGREIAVLNSNEPAFNDADLADDTRQILVTAVNFTEATGMTTLTVEYNFDLGVGVAWTGGSLIALEDLDLADDADLLAVGGTIHLEPGNPNSILLFDTLEAADLGWPRWLDIRIQNLQMEFSDFRADDSDNTLKLDALFLGFNTGSPALNEVIRKVLRVSGSVSGVQFDLDRLAEATLLLGLVQIPKNPIVDISGISGEISGDIFFASLTAGFIVKQIGIDSNGLLTTQDSQTVKTVLYGAVRGALNLGGTKVVDPGTGETKTVGGFSVGLNLAISELGPLQFFVFSNVNIILDPISGLSITGLRGGLRFNSTLEDLQVRPPFSATGGSAEATGDVLKPVRITLTLPGHNLKPGDEFRVTSAADADLLGEFVVSNVNGDDVSYLVVGEVGNFSFITPIEVRKLSISDPLDLRDPGFKSTKDLTLVQWEAQLDQQVVNQANAGDSLWDVLFDNVVIEAGATLSFAPRIPSSVLCFDVDLLLDTELRLLITGKMTLLTVLPLPAKLFADLSDIGGGSITFLLLADVPAIPPNAIGLMPLLVLRAGVTFETLINGVPASLDAATGFPVGVGFDVTGAIVLDLAAPGEGPGPWAVTFLPDLPDGVSPSDEFAVGDDLVVVASDPSTFDGTFRITQVDDGAGTITFVIGAAVKASGIDVNLNGVPDALDNGLLDGIPVLGARLDLNRNGKADEEDDGEVFTVVRDASGNRRVVGYTVIDGWIDIDGDGNVTSDPDDVGVIGDDPGAWTAGSVVANEDDLGDGFRITVDGGIDLNIPFVTTLALDGSAMLDVVLPGPGSEDDVRIDFTIDMALSETSVGNIGLAVGKLHLTADLDLMDDEGGITFPHVELWGAALLTTNFEFLQRLGLFASASGVLRINSTISAKPDEVLYDTANNPINVTLPARSFALRLDGSVDFRINFDGDKDEDGNNNFETIESVFLLEGIFVLEFSAEQGFNVAIFRDDNGTVGPATLRVGPASSPFLQFDVFGFLAIRPLGIAANMILSLDASLPGALASVASINGQFVFMVNTTFTDVSFTIPGNAAGPNRPTDLTVIIPRAPPESITGASFNVFDLIAGNAWTVDPSTLGGAYVLIHMGGTDPTNDPDASLDIGPFSLRGQFSFLLGATVHTDGSIDLLLEISAEYSLTISAGSMTFLSFDGTGFLRFDNSGLVASLSLNQASGGGVPDSFGFNFGGSSSFDLEINTTGASVDHDNKPFTPDIRSGLRLHITGMLQVGSVLDLSGTFDFTIDIESGEFTIELNARISVFGTTLEVEGFAGIYYGDNPGFAFKIQLKLGPSDDVTVSPLAGFFTISGAFHLEINTSNATRDGIDPQSFEIGVTNLVVNLFGFELSGSLTIGISSAGLSIDIPAPGLTLDFFGLATLSVSGYLKTDGQFSFTATAGITIGNPNLFGVAGTISVTFSNSGFAATVTGQVAAFGVKIGATGNITITGAQVKLSIWVSAVLFPAVNIDINMPWPIPDIHIHTPEVRVSAWATWILGTTTEAPSPPTLATRLGDGTLRLNLGADVTYRGDQSLYGPEAEEHYIITRVGAGESVKVSALGFEQTYDNILRILVNDTQNGNTYIKIDSALAAAVDINASSTPTGNNRFITGAGFATIGGGIGSNAIEIGSGGGTYTVGAGTGTVQTISDNSSGNLTVYAPSFGNYQLSDDALIYGKNTMTFTDVKRVILNGATDATYSISFTSGQAPWTGTAMLNGLGTASAVQATTTGNMLLTDVLLNASNAMGTVHLSNIKVATLSGSAGDNTFTVTDWTGTATLDGAGNGDTYTVNLKGSGSGTTTIDDSSGSNSATVNGTSSADTIVITTTQVTRESETVNYTSTDTLVVNGNDAIDIFQVTDTSITTTINGNAGNDQFTVSDNHSTLTLNGNADNDQFTINDSNSTLIVNGDANDDQFTVNSNSFALTLNGNDDSDTMTVNATGAALTMNGGDGGDTFNIRSIGAVATVNAGPGSDTINVGSDTSNVNGIAALLTVNGNEPSSGSDIINVDDTGDTSGNTGNLTSTQLYGLGMASGITYGTIETLNISLGLGEDTFTIQSTHSGSTTVSTGAGADTIVINGADGTLTVNGQADDDVFTVNGTGASSSSTLNGQAGNDTFNIKAINGPVVVSGGGDSDTINVGSDGATVTVTETPGNKAPVANDDSAGTPEDTAVTIDVLADDTDEDDGDPLMSVAFVTQGANGTVTNNGTDVTYTPAADFNGVDSFTYTASDGNGGFDSATVTVTVTPVNDAPVAVDDAYTTDEDTALVVAAPGMLGNDSDADGDTLTVTDVTDPSHGMVVINGDGGTITYTPTENYNGADSFTYTASDGNGGFASATVMVTVTPVNDAPVAVDDDYSVHAGQVLQIAAPGLLANDSDADGDTLTVTLLNVTGTQGSVVAFGDGHFSFTPTAGFVGDTSFTYTISDGFGGSDTATATVHVTNAAPVAGDDAYTVRANRTLDIAAPGLLGNDTDADGDALTVTLLNVTGTQGSVVAFGDGHFSYTPTANFTGQTSFTYTISDGLGGNDTGTVTIDVVNAAPLAGDDDYSVHAGQVLQIAAPGLLANDSDADGDTLTVTLLNVTGTQGSVVAFGDGHFSFTPTAGFVGDTSFTYTISDGFGGSDTATATVHVTNAAPVAGDDSATTAEDTAVTIAVLTNDSDPDGDLLTVTSVGAPGNGSAAINYDGTVTYSPDAGFAGEDTFTYTVEDDDGATDTATVTVIVRNLVDLSGRVFDDRDNDGIFDQEDGDIGIPGVTVELLKDPDSIPGNGDEVLLGTTTTLTDDPSTAFNEEGFYEFDNASNGGNLSAGTYIICETQPTEYLDGKETAGDIGSTVDNTKDFNEITGIFIGPTGTTPDAGGYNFAELQPSSMKGVVWEDFNDDGEIDFDEKTIENVTIILSGTDDRETDINLTTQTDLYGIYMFYDLRPGEYMINEIQPVSFVDGKDSLGTVNSIVTGDNSVDDLFSDVILSEPGSVVENYNFGERPLSGSEVTAGQTATIGFWQNKNGQKLIRSLNGGPDSTQLGDWLAATFPNMYGVNADANNLAGMTNAEVADFYSNLFRRKKKDAMQLGLGGPTKMDAQVMAAAFAVYVTNSTLAGTTASTFGFTVTEYGVGISTFNVGFNGYAFGLKDNSDETILNLLLAINNCSTNGILYDLNDDGDAIDDLEILLRTMVNDVLSAINEQGDI